MPDQYSVIVTKPGHDTVRIGPFHWSTQADNYRAMLNQQLTNTAHPEGTHATSGPYDPDLPHTPLLPTDPYEIAELMDEGLAGDPEARFPDLYTRLVAQLGWDRSTELWQKACQAYDAMHAEEEQPEPVADQPTYYLAEYEGATPALFSSRQLAQDYCDDFARTEARGRCWDWMPEEDGVQQQWWVHADDDRPVASTGGVVTVLQVDAEADSSGS